MVYILPISMLLIGLAVGAGACWLVLNTKLKHVADNARSEANAEISGLKADVSNRDAAIEQLKTEISEARTALKDLQDDFTTLKAREAQLETTIKQERKQAAEKLEVLNQAQEKLSDAFKALSSDALKNNNESFLKLAKATLEKFQEGAKGDLEKRQQAIDALVKPLEKSLKQVDDNAFEIPWFATNPRWVVMVVRVASWLRIRRFCQALSTSDCTTSKNSSTRVLTLLMFWPPGPLLRVRRTSSSASEISNPARTIRP